MTDATDERTPPSVRDAKGRFLKGSFPPNGFKPGLSHPRVIEKMARETLGKRRYRSRRRFGEELRDGAFNALDFLNQVMRGKVKATPAQISIAHRLIECAYGKEALLDGYGREVGKASAGKPIVVVSRVPRPPKSGGI